MTSRVRGGSPARIERAKHLALENPSVREQRDVGAALVTASGQRGLLPTAGKLVIGSGFATATFSGFSSATHDDPTATNITTSHPVTIVGGVGYRRVFNVVMNR